MALALKKIPSGSLAEPRRMIHASPTSSTRAVAAPAMTMPWPAGPACSQRVS
ncbi:hypothetical protein D9M68_1011130 [compost metagenome]